MLTKQEREAIARRAQRVNGEYERDAPYFVLTGNLTPGNTAVYDDYKKMSLIINDLCDTSDMMELPRDKAGKVIHIGDTVYDENMNKCSVKSIEYGKDNNVCIHCFTFSALGTLSYYPHQLTHQFISEAEQLAKALKHAVDTFNEYLRELASYIGSLGDNND